METKNELFKTMDSLIKRINHITNLINANEFLLNPLWDISDEDSDIKVVFLPMDDYYDYSFTDENIKSIFNFAKSLLPDDNARLLFEKHNKDQVNSCKESIKLIRELTSTAEQEHFVDFSMFEDETTIPALLAKYQSIIKPYLSSIKNMRDLLSEVIEEHEPMEEKLFRNWG